MEIFKTIHQTIKSKKLSNKIIISIIIIFMLACSYTTCIATSNKTIEKSSRDFVVKLPYMKLIFKDKLLFSGENNTVSAEKKDLNNYIILGISCALTAYWIGLLFVFEREELYDYENKDDMETLKKYNPLFAGCIVDNREVLPRDIIAIILNLIKKDYIKMKMQPNPNIEKEDYIYVVSINKEKFEKLDATERYVINWFFDYYELKEINLIERLKQISRSKDLEKRIAELNNIAEKELHKMGANLPMVPIHLKIFNFVLLFCTIIFSAIHIINNGINIHIYQTTFWLFMFILAAIFLVIPVVALGIHALVILVFMVKKLIKGKTQEYSGKSIVETSVVVIFFMILLVIIAYLGLPNKYICLDIYMVGIAFLIVRTDQQMTKHSATMLNDYYSLNEIKYRIEEYSLIKDEQINYMKLWDEYFIYAVAFGIPIPIIKRIRTTYKEDNNLAYLAKCEGLYYICKAYLEVMWEMDFKPKNKKYLKNFPLKYSSKKY